MKTKDKKISKPGLREKLPWLHLFVYFIAMAALDLGLMHFFSFAQTVDPAVVRTLRLFSLGWCLLLTGLAAILPGLWRRLFMALTALAFSILAIVHGVFINMFNKFFSFADISFAGDGAAFVDGSYLMIRRLLLVFILGCLALAMAAVLLAPRPRRSCWKSGLALSLAGLCCIAWPRYTVLNQDTAIIWNQNTDPSFLYQDFSDSRACLTMLGLYQYTWRDLTGRLDMGSGITEQEQQELEQWLQERGHEDNEMTGVFAGKNLMVIQLESIDTWMLTPEYMPNLYGVKENSMVFQNHYTPAYITAGTFNTEFMVNTSLLPADSSTPTTVYSHNDFSNSMPSLFAEAGYLSQSFHGSEGDVYNRGAVHENLGYAKYWSGNDMGMENYQFDRYLMSGYEAMTEGEPFFSFIITFSGHGAYGPDNLIGQAHQAEADAVAQRSEDNYRYAVSHAMETDLFIGELMERLEEDGLLENTVLLFYADHYNYYMLDDTLNKELKGVDTLNQLTHTDLFLYDGGVHREPVEKVTFSLDVLPTIANLFGLDADYAAMLGHDAFSADGGYVFFQDNSWYDGVQWSGELRQDVIDTRAMGQLILKGDYFAEE